MPQQSRISRAEFERMRGFRRVSGEFFTLSWGNIPGRTASGAAAVVSKKVVASASARNKIKRRVRAIFTELLKQQNTPLAFVVLAKKGAAGASFREIRSDIENLMARARSSR